MKILMIEDDADVATNVAEYLEPRGFQMDFAYDGMHGFALAAGQSHAAIILDLGLPGLDGVDVCRRLRGEGRDTPILMLTARDELEQKVHGFQAGADDYLVKPFALPELHHRLIALIRRAEGVRDTAIRVADLVVDPTTREVRRDGQSIHLNRIEFQVLETLARAAPRLVTRETIERVVWGQDTVARDLLRSYVYRIRQRVDKPFATPLLQTVHGEGYRLRDY